LPINEFKPPYQSKNELRVFASLADAKTLLDWRGGGGAAYGIFTWLSERGGGW
jgi:hypothetical protein